MHWFEYAWLFPIGVLIAIAAMSSGISGANFWFPVYSICVGVDERIAFWLSLLTMVFGFGSGVLHNLKAGSISWKIAFQYLSLCIPGVILGSYLSNVVDLIYLLSTFGSFIFIYSFYTFFQYRNKSAILIKEHDKIFFFWGFFSGLIKGFITVGLGIILLIFLLKHQKIKNSAEAVGTLVFIIFIANLFALVGRMNLTLLEQLQNNYIPILSIMIWVAPSVIIGGQIGPYVVKNFSKEKLKIYVACLLILVGLSVYYRVFSIVV